MEGFLSSPSGCVPEKIPGAPEDIYASEPTRLPARSTAPEQTVLGLEHLGAEVCVAETGSEALKKAPSFRPTRVLLDIDPARFPWRNG